MADHQEQGSSPNEAIFFVLTYLPLFELLLLTRVCRSLRDAVKNDTLPWLKMVVDRPLNRRLSDDRLVELASRAQPRLQLLLLINCLNITDDGLFRVIAHNPRITKLHVPGCTGLTPEGMVRAVQLLTKDNHRLQSLKISGIYGVRKEDLQTLRGLIYGVRKEDLQTLRGLIEHKKDKTFIHDYYKFSTMKQIETDSSIDVDICPKCNEVRMVFDCPRLLCEKQQQKAGAGECRGCESCITRCVECGVCLKGIQELEEASCADAMCLECWLKLPKCNFCNKPYCSNHAYQQHTVSESTGFICATCHSKFN